MRKKDEMKNGLAEVTGETAHRAYEGASQLNHELALWNPSLRSADDEILPSKNLSEARLRDTMRNDAYVQHGAQIQKDSIVGEHFLLNAKPRYRVLGLDAAWSEEFQEEVEEKFTLFAESIHNYPDAARKNTLTGLIRLAVGIHAVSGEVLASCEWRRTADRPYFSALQLIDSERLCNPPWIPESPTCRGGVEKDRFGAPKGYWIRLGHPNSIVTGAEGFEWKYVPATRGAAVGIPGWRRPQMIHIIDQTRPDQTRGISAMVAALKEMRMTKKFRDTVLQNAVLNATYAASIESELPADVALAQAGGADPEAISRYSTSYLTEIAKYNRRGIHIDGVKVPVFFPGTKMKLQPAGNPGGIGSDFEASTLRYIASSLGVSYEQLSKDYSSSNYSNLRAAMAETGKRMRVQKKLVADRVASIYYALWLEEAIAAGHITSLPRNAPSWYEGLNSDAYAACEWIGAGTGQIDELKETQAAVLRINNGLSTREAEISKLGRDWRDVFRQLEREKAQADNLGLDFGSDTMSRQMMNAASGTPTDDGKNPSSSGE